MMNRDDHDVRADLGYVPAPAAPWSTDREHVTRESLAARRQAPAQAHLRAIDRDGDDLVPATKLEPAVVEQGRSWVARLREQLAGVGRSA